jgi:hypothetical protein
VPCLQGTPLENVKNPVKHPVVFFVMKIMQMPLALCHRIPSVALQKLAHSNEWMVDQAASLFH